MTSIAWLIYNTHGSYSFKLQRACTKECLLSFRPESSQGFDFGDIEEDWLPPRAQPEADSLLEDNEWLLLKLVEAAVWQVGWVPRDVYKFLAAPETFGMFHFGSNVNA